MEETICTEKRIHPEAVGKAAQELPEDGTLYALAEFFRVFGDVTRIKILYALSKSELCVCDLAEIAGTSQSAVSHQLQILRSMRLVRCRREGKTVYYTLDDAHIFTIIDQGTEHIKE